MYCSTLVVEGEVKKGYAEVACRLAGNGLFLKKNAHKIMVSYWLYCTVPCKAFFFVRTDGGFAGICRRIRFER